VKGIVFNLLEDVVVAHHGEDGWDMLLEAAGLEGAYTSLGSYPSEHIAKLVAAASKAFGISETELQRWVGREATPILAARFPEFFQPHNSARDFVIGMNSIIHPEVHKLYPDADVPTFEFRPTDNDDLLLGYRSPKCLCALTQGFIEGAAIHFHETIDIECLQCMHHGSPQCLMQISFRQAA
jgi:hypothetical protein